MSIVENAFSRVNPSRRLFPLAACVASALFLGGCYSEGGLGWSADQFVYVSHEYQPWSITVKDTRSGQDIWWIDVPVGQQLVIHFIPGDKPQPGFTPGVMEWALMVPGTEFARLPNRIAVPDKNSRRVDAHLRPTPELPSNMRPGEARPVMSSSVNEATTSPSDR